MENKRNEAPHWIVSFFGEYLERVVHKCSVCGYYYITNDGVVEPRDKCDKCKSDMRTDNKNSGFDI